MYVQVMYVCTYIHLYSVFGRASHRFRQPTTSHYAHHFHKNLHPQLHLACGCKMRFKNSNPVHTYRSEYGGRLTKHAICGKPSITLISSQHLAAKPIDQCLAPDSFFTLWDSARNLTAVTSECHRPLFQGWSRVKSTQAQRSASAAYLMGERCFGQGRGSAADRR